MSRGGEGRRKPRVRLWVLALWVVGIYAALIIGVRLFGDRLVFIPGLDASTDWTLPNGFEEVWFGSPRLMAWYAKAQDTKITVLFAHGNAGDIAGRSDILQRLRGLGVGVFAFDYRGYGKSQGSPSEDGIYADALAAFDYLVQSGLEPGRIVVLGQSLGSTAATYVAVNRNCGGLILEAPMESASAMAAKVLPFPPVGWALDVRLDNMNRVPRIKCPIMVVHGSLDMVVPFDQGKAIFKAANEPKRFITFEGRGHNDLWEGESEQYLQAIREFIADNTEGSRQAR